MLAHLLPLALLPSLAAAYSFNFDSTPRECDTLSVSITGQGQPPYSLLIIPFGPSPLPNNAEVRKITQQNFTGSSTSTSLQLKYPANSQFVAVVSDSSGFGSGGTSGVVTVLSGDSSSCYDVSAPVTPTWVYSLVPNSLTQCAGTRIWWDETTGLVQGCVLCLLRLSIPLVALTDHTTPVLLSSRELSLEASHSPSLYLRMA